MNREEAIKVLNARPYTGEVREALETLIPELKESEDERVRKWIYNLVSDLDPQDEDAEKELDEMKPLALAWLEKQKEASKAIEAVERIDKYIDEHLANAHDMKDSDPDKKYYLGWDAALGKMAGILLDVYSGEKQKEQKPFWNPTEEDVVLFNKAITTNMTLTPQERAKLDIIRMKFKHCPYIEQKEQKPAEWSEEDEKNLELVIDCIYEFYPDPVMKYKLKDWLKSLRPRSSWKSSEQKVQKINKWSKKDKKILQSLHHVMNCADAQNIVKRDGLSVEDVCTFLFSIEPNWKPSKEQMKILNWAANGMVDKSIGAPEMRAVLRELYEQLKVL